jgi:hypothetical protein
MSVMIVTRIVIDRSTNHEVHFDHIQIYILFVMPPRYPWFLPFFPAVLTPLKRPYDQTWDHERRKQESELVEDDPRGVSH